MLIHGDVCMLMYVFMGMVMYVWASVFMPVYVCMCMDMHGHVCVDICLCPSSLYGYGHAWVMYVWTSVYARVWLWWHVSLQLVLLAGPTPGDVSTQWRPSLVPPTQTPNEGIFRWIKGCVHTRDLGHTFACASQPKSVKTHWMARGIWSLIPMAVCLRVFYFLFFIFYFLGV
jgi:hypothetical protein